MVYPGRNVLDPLPRFACANRYSPHPQLRAELAAFVREQYEAGRSLRDISELTGRSWSWVRKELARQGVVRRGHDANRVWAETIE